MRKIPTVFVRDWDGDRRHVTGERHPDCAWVFAGEGTATRKYDGTCVMFDGARWWARREVKAGKAPPPEFVALATDDETGKTVGWEPVEQSSFAKLHAEAADEGGPWQAGTYELCGPKVNRNPEGLDRHELIAHATATVLTGVPLDYDGLAKWLQAHAYEGIVWHHEDGRMAKLKRRDLH